MERWEDGGVPRSNLARVVLFYFPPLFTQSSVCLMEAEIIAAHAQKVFPQHPVGFEGGSGGG